MSQNITVIITTEDGRTVKCSEYILYKYLDDVVLSDDYLKKEQILELFEWIKANLNVNLMQHISNRDKVLFHVVRIGDFSKLAAGCEAEVHVLLKYIRNQFKNRLWNQHELCEIASKGIKHVHPSQNCYETSENTVHIIHIPKHVNIVD